MKPLYAIRHKPTGHYLPEPTGHCGRGGSFTEPVNCSGERNPRLFVSALSAKRALTAWLMGKHYPVTEYEDGHTYTVGAEVQHIPHRKKEDMEIVELHLTVKP